MRSSSERLNARAFTFLIASALFLSAGAQDDDNVHPDPRLQGVGVPIVGWTMARLEEEVKLHPKSALAYLRRGNAHLADTDIEAAMPDFNQAIALDPKCTRAYIGRYYVYTGLRQFDKALAELKKAQEIGPSDLAIDALNLQAFLHKELHQFPQALDEYTRVIKANLFSKSRLAWAYLDRGVTYDRLAKLNEAIVDYTTVIKLDPLFGRAYMYRANDYRTLQDYKKALADYTFVIDHVEHPVEGKQKGFDPVRKEVYKNRSLLYKLMGRPDLSKADLVSYLRKEKEDLDMSPFQGR